MGVWGDGGQQVEPARYRQQVPLVQGTAGVNPAARGMRMLCVSGTLPQARGDREE
jgi:hypothetical protein